MNIFFSRRRVMTVAFCSLLFLGLASRAVASSFSDVPEDTVNFNAVEYLKQKNVVEGYEDGTFQPDKPINRAEALKVVLLATEAGTDSNVTLSFPDVLEDDWFYQYVGKAFELKIVEGYPDGKFKAGNNINMAESLKMILLAFGEELSTQIGENPYPDVEKDLWYARYADYCKKKLLIETLGDGKLHAEREISRGEFARIIYRLLYIKEKQLESFPMSTDWPVYTHPTDHYLVKVPFDWQKFEIDGHLILWKQDKGNNQISFGRVFPNSATMAIAVDPNKNGLSFDDYLSDLNYYQSGIMQKMTLNSYPFATVSINGANSFDYFFELTNKTFLAAFADIGDGLNKPQMLEELRNIIGSIRYTEEATGLTDRDAFLAKIREKILVQGASEEALDLFTEIILVETDTIGIGTGPVDYYYSGEYDVTLKIDRDSKTLLGVRDGKTVSF